MNAVREQARGLRAGVSGFSLIEVVIALAVIAVTFIGLIGLLGLGVANDQVSTQQTIATNVAASILSDLRSTPAYAYGGTGSSTLYGLTLPTGPAAAGTPVSNGTTPLNGAAVKTYYLYFDNSPSFLPLTTPQAYTSPQSPVPTGAIYAAAVYLTRVAYIGPTATASLAQSNVMVRVAVFWPAQTTTVPAGNVDVVSQFLIH